MWEGPTSHPTRVVAVINSDHAVSDSMLAEDQARWDDAYWLRVANGPFSWQRFLNWWVARRWVRPRDITKE